MTTEEQAPSPPAAFARDHRVYLNVGFQARNGFTWNINTPGYETVDEALDTLMHVVDRINAKFGEQAEMALDILRQSGAIGVINVRGETTQFASADLIAQYNAQHKKEG